MSESEFLTLDDVLGIHVDPIRVYGGASGLRDLALLRSAIDKAKVSAFSGASRGCIGKGSSRLAVREWD